VKKVTAIRKVQTKRVAKVANLKVTKLEIASVNTTTKLHQMSLLLVAKISVCEISSHVF
jgi:hypothetical protein